MPAKKAVSKPKANGNAGISPAADAATSLGALPAGTFDPNESWTKQIQDAMNDIKSCYGDDR
jgi:hypothetical protein